MLLIGSFSKGLTATGAFTLEKYIKAYSNPALPRILLNTLIFVLGSAAFASLLAFTLAYLNVRTDIPFKGLFNVIPVIPMMVPHILFAVSWMLLLNPSNGIVNLSIRTLFHTHGSLFNIYTLPGMIFVEGLLDLPIAYLIIAPAMASFDPSLEEASRISGASGWRTLRRITLPVLKPALLASFTLVLVRSLAAFAVPTMIGMPGRVYVLSTHIYRLISTGYATDYGEAAAVGVIVLATSITFIFVYRKLTSETEKYVTVSGKGYRPAVIGLGKYKYPILGIVGILLLFMIVLPVLTLLYTSLLPYSMVPSARAFSMMNLNNWRTVFHDPISIRALKNSVFLGIVGATLGVLLSALIAYTVVRVKSVTSAILETSVFLSFSFPGLVIGVGFMWFFVRTPLYATLAALLIGYIATYLPYGVRPLTSAFVQIHKDLEDSSRVCGASFLYTLRRVIAPLLIPGFVSAWILMVTMFLRELSLSVVLSRPGTEVLAVRILNFADDSLWGQVSALGIVMILISSTLVLMANLTGQWASRKR
ncbi:MAG: iron ABC transporter permease [Thermotogae bacterium]|nr:MAG: iron ABC transporter permease [Thermotogota bacterium]